MAEKALLSRRKNKVATALPTAGASATSTFMAGGPNTTTWRLANMNLTIRGISSNISSEHAA